MSTQCITDDSVAVANDKEAQKPDAHPRTALPAELDPREWPSRKKWTNLTLIAVQATLVPICSGIIAVAAEQIDSELHITNSHVSALPVALYVLGLGLGPLYLAPLSELYGRRIIYIVFFAIFSLLNVGCALVHNAPGLIVLRFLAGVAGRYGIFAGLSSSISLNQLNLTALGQRSVAEQLLTCSSHMNVAALKPYTALGPQ